MKTGTIYLIGPKAKKQYRFLIQKNIEENKLTINVSLYFFQ